MQRSRSFSTMARLVLGGTVALGLSLCAMLGGTPSAQAAPTLRLPWQGTWRVTNGLHNGGYASYIPGGVAWDFGDTRDVLAMGTGTAKVICTDYYQKAVLLTVGSDRFIYLHLAPSSVAHANGTSWNVAQGDIVGRPSQANGGYFTGACGTSQGTHLHLVLPRTGMIIDGYTFTASSVRKGMSLTSSNRPGVPSTPTVTQPPSAVKFTAKVMVNANRRTGPGTNYAANGVFPAGSSVGLICYVWGGGGSGYYGYSTLWYRTNQSGLYVNDANIYTGTNNPVTPHC